MVFVCQFINLMVVYRATVPLQTWCNIIKINTRSDRILTEFKWLILVLLQYFLGSLVTSSLYITDPISPDTTYVNWILIVSQVLIYYLLSKFYQTMNKMFILKSVTNGFILGNFLIMLAEFDLNAWKDWEFTMPFAI